MKRILCATLAFLMLLGAAGTALAADIVVQVIGEMEEETESVNLDDLKLKTEAEIDGWGIITLTEFDFIDSFHVILIIFILRYIRSVKYKLLRC